MATYFPNSNNQRDATQMLYLREQLPTSYSETQPLSGNNMMMYMNTASYPDSLAGNTSGDIGPQDTTASQQEFLSNLGGTRVADQDFSSWRDNRSDMMMMNPILQGGLSLSLSPQIPTGVQISPVQYRNPNTGFSSFLGPNSTNLSFRDDENPQKGSNVLPNVPNLGTMKADMSNYGVSSGRAVPSSKYLKATQELLDEVVNVRKALKQHEFRKDLMKDSKESDGGGGSGRTGGGSSNPQESSNNSPRELSVADKQDLQNKMTKLLSMLEEVDRRYKQYYHQMQIVVSSFDAIAGTGAAKPYTALALQTISRHFRSLRDSINGQIRSTQRSLGDHDGSGTGTGGVGISRLRYVDQQLRQQRALQQLGMMQQHTWRPQRGLPESSVSILRAWLFEHFLHPYPKDSDKIMLARQTGLTRSQVSNWFINARVRLWKPMVEEMYKEEAGEAEMDSSSSSPKSTNGGTATKSSEGVTDKLQQQQQQQQTATSSSIFDVDMVGSGSGFQNMAHNEGKHKGDQTSFYPENMVPPSGTQRFMAATAYHVPEPPVGRFGQGSGVSLTLGLQHREDAMLPGSVRNDQGYEVYGAPVESVGQEGEEFDCLESGSTRQHNGFGSSHLLHDFVA
jgi:hypothetical protein